MKVLSKEVYQRKTQKSLGNAHIYMVERKRGTRKTEKANLEGNRLVSCVGIKGEHDLRPALRISF